MFVFGLIGITSALVVHGDLYAIKAYTDVRNEIETRKFGVKAPDKIHLVTIPAGGPKKFYTSGGTSKKLYVARVATCTRQVKPVGTVGTLPSDSP